MNARWKRILVLIAGNVIVCGSLAISAWEFVAMHRAGTTGLVCVAVVGPENKSLPAGSVPWGLFPGTVVVVVPGGPAHKAGILPGDQVISINGASVYESQKIRSLDAATRRADVLLYRVRRGQAEIVAPVRVETLFASTPWLATLGTQVAVGFVFLGVGWLVFWKKAGDRRGLVLYWMLTISGSVFINNAAYSTQFYAARLGWRGSPLDSLRPTLVSVPLSLGFLLLPLLLHLALIFPREHRLLTRYPVMIRWIYWLPLFSLTANIAVLSGALLAARRGLSPFGYGVWLTTTVVGAGVALFMLAKYRRRLSSPGWKAGLISRPIITMALFCLALYWLRLTTELVLHPIGAPNAVKVVVTLLLVLVPGLLLFISLLGYPIAACWVLFTSYRASGAEEKRQLQWPLWGIVVSQAGKVALSLIVIGTVSLVGIRPLLAGPVLTAQQILSALLAALIPVSFAVAILKYRLMEIDLVIRRTVLYSLLTGVVVIFYFVLVGGLGRLVVRFTGMKGESIAVIATVLVAAAFLPLRNRVQGMVDQRFFRKRHDYPQILKALQQQMVEVASLNALLALIVENVQQALRARSVAFFLSDEAGGLRIAAKIGLPDQTPAKVGLSSARAPLQRFSGVHEIQELNWTQEDQAALQIIGAKLLAAIRFKGALLGILTLGAKLSGETYDNEDREFLGSLADQVAAAMDTQRLREQERDFERGREIQQALLPKQIPAVAGYSIATAWQPARRVSGDYYDVFPLGSGKLALCIADVAGKGLPAALLMSNLQAAVKSIATETVEPRKLCETINRVICGNVVEGRFISFFFGLLDAPARKLAYTNAGHNAPVVARRDGTVIRLEEGGPVFGVLENTLFAQGELALAAGDRLLLFTDGVSEAANAEHEEFGEERLTALLLESPAENAQALQSRVIREVSQFCANRFQDDATVVVLVVNEQAASAASA